MPRGGDRLPPSGANGGTVYRPFIIDRIEGNEERPEATTEPESWPGGEEGDCVVSEAGTGLKRLLQTRKDAKGGGDFFAGFAMTAQRRWAEVGAGSLAQARKRRLAQTMLLARRPMTTG